MHDLSPHLQFLLQQGFGEIKVSEKSVLEHLLGVYRRLQSWHCPELLCIAGLYHSIYENNHSAIEKRKEVAKRIGKESEELVYLFHRMDPFSSFIENNETSVFDHETKKKTILTNQNYRHLATLLLAHRIETLNASKNQALDYQNLCFYQGLYSLVDPEPFDDFQSSLVRVEDNWLPKKLITKLVKGYKLTHFHFYAKSNETLGAISNILSHWHLDIADGENSRRDYSRNFQRNKREFPAEYAVWEIIKKHFGKVDLLRAYVNAANYGTEGLPHIDSKFVGDMTAVVYLNDAWDPMWAGETVILNKKNEIEQSILPRLGRILIFPSTKMHSARGLSRFCPALRTVLVFKFCPRYLNSTNLKIP